MSEVALSAESVVKAAGGQMSCDLAGEAAILNMTTGVYYGLDPIGARIWKLVEESPRTVADIRDVLLAEYEVTPEACEEAIVALMRQLAEHGLVEVRPPDAA